MPVLADETNADPAVAEAGDAPVKKKMRRLLPASVSKRAESNAPGTVRFSGRIVYCSTEKAVEDACSRLLEHPRVSALGFDLEWRIFFKKGDANIGKTALVQFCASVGENDLGPLAALPWTFVDEKVRRLESGREYLCFLLHIHHAGVPQALKDVLTSTRYVFAFLARSLALDAILSTASPSSALPADARLWFLWRRIKKYGVNVNCDFIKMEKDHGVRIEGGADLCHLAARLPRMVKRFGPDSKLSFSLADLCALFLSGRGMDKASQVRLGNWEKEGLDYPAKKYAATDAYVGLRVVERIIEEEERSSL